MCLLWMPNAWTFGLLTAHTFGLLNAHRFALLNVLSLQFSCDSFVEHCFYSPESIKNRNDVFYLVPERSCVPDSPVWYSTQSINIDSMTRMLNRLRVVREIQEAHLTTMNPYYGWNGRSFRDATSLILQIVDDVKHRASLFWKHGLVIPNLYLLDAVGRAQTRQRSLRFRRRRFDRWTREDERLRGTVVCELTLGIIR